MGRRSKREWRVMPGLDLDTDAVYAVLARIRGSLRADGYDLDVLAVGDTVDLAIYALPDACDDCLVGKPLMVEMVAGLVRTMEPSAGPEHIRIRYPGESS